MTDPTTANGPGVGDGREGLAAVIVSEMYAVNPSAHDSDRRNVAARYAAAILASPWLAAHVAAAVAGKDAEIERLRAEVRGSIAFRQRESRLRYVAEHALGAVAALVDEATRGGLPAEHAVVPVDHLRAVLAPVSGAVEGADVRMCGCRGIDQQVCDECQAPVAEHEQEVAAKAAEEMRELVVDPYCLERNPGLDEWHGSCCRFPKSCSPYVDADALARRLATEDQS